MSSFRYQQVTQAKGSALIVAMVLVILMASLSTVLVKEISERAKHVEVDLEDIKAFEAAEAGIDAALNDVNSSPVYQPTLSSPLLTDLGEIVKPEAAIRISPGILNKDGTMPREIPVGANPITGASIFSGAILDNVDKLPGKTRPGTGYPLVTPITKKPIAIHVARKADGTKPGCLGTSDWVKTTDDLIPDGRPTWRAIPFQATAGGTMVYDSGPMKGLPRYSEDNIVPQSLGSVAFYTYTIDWFHDGIDNDLDGLVDDRNERNKFTVYSTGIHRGISQSGVTETGRVVTIEVMAQAQDKDLTAIPNGALEVQIRNR